MKLFYLVSTLTVMVWTYSTVPYGKVRQSYHAVKPVTLINSPSFFDLPQPIQSGGSLFTFADISADIYTQQLFINSRGGMLHGVTIPGNNPDHNYDSLEAYLIRHDGLPFLRQDSCLVISLENGKTTCLCDNTSKKAHEKYESYQLIDHHQPVGFYQFVVSHYEERENLLISAETGEKFPVWDYAFLSPDSQRFFVCSFDLEAGFAPNGMQVWKVKGNKLVKEFELQIPNWGPVEPVWLNGNELLFKRIYLDPENGKEIIKYAKMTIR
jgi:hypothetical protein